MPSLKTGSKVSIVIPVYNGANYLREAIDSAVNQTYRNCEILVINDGSNDGGATRAIAESYGARIRYIEKPNGGVASALNVAIDNMTGDYFSWLSHDDVYLPQKVGREIAMLPAAGRAIVYSNFEVIDSRSRPLHDVRHQKLYSVPQLNHRKFPLLNNLVHGCTLLIPKAAFAVARFDESLKHTQDVALWFELFQHFPLLHCPQILVRSRVHDRQDSKLPGRSVERLRELNSLWLKLFESVTDAEMLEMHGSYEAFYRRALWVLERVQGPDAFALLLQRWSEYRSHAKVSVVLVYKSESPELQASLDSIQKQTHGQVELLRMHAVNITLADARNAGVREATGEYVCFLEPGDVFLPEKIQTQLTFMQAGGFAVTHSSYFARNLESLEMVRAGETDICSPKIFGRYGVRVSTLMATREWLKTHPFEEEAGQPILGDERLVGIHLPLVQVRTREVFSDAQLERAAKSISTVYWLYLFAQNHFIKVLKTPWLNMLLKPAFNLLPRFIQMPLRRIF